MKFLIFLSLFFYQTLHANILYPLPTHKFDFSTSTYNYNSSNLSKKRTVASNQIDSYVLHQINRGLADGASNTLLDLVTESLQQGADPNHRFYSHSPYPLQAALRNRTLTKELPLTEQTEKIVETLLQHGADPNLYFEDLPALHLAVFLRSPKAVRLLIKYGANVNLKFKGVTPLLLVVNPPKLDRNFRLYGSNKKNETDLRNKENLNLDKQITQALLDERADINAKPLGGNNTLLVNALLKKNTGLASFLIERGADVKKAIRIIKKDGGYKYSPSSAKYEAALKFLETHQKKEIQNRQNLKKQASCPGAFG